MCRLLIAAVILIPLAAFAQTPATQPTTTRPALDNSAVIAPHSIIQLDIPYVPDGTDKQTLDVYAPRDAREAAAIVYLHGGEWAKRDKEEVSYKPKFLNSNGILLVSANYRLSGTDKHPAQGNDVAAALMWVRDNISRFGGSPNKIYLMGHSAGCHLATLVGLDPRWLGSVGMKPSDLAGVISWSGGAFDLVDKVHQGGMYKDYIRRCFGESESAWADASPMNHVTDTKPLPRFLFVSAEFDNASSIEASAKMVALINSAGGDASKFIVAGKNHGGADHDLGSAGDESGTTLLNWINKAR